MDDKAKQYISWSANDEFSQDFAEYYRLAQKGFLGCRNNPKNIVQAFDFMHEIYRMEKPYLDKKDLIGLEKTHDELKDRINTFFSKSQNPIFIKNNFWGLHKEVDEFFTAITQIAVDKQFFPKVSKERSFRETVTNGLKQR